MAHRRLSMTRRRRPDAVEHAHPTSPFADRTGEHEQHLTSGISGENK
jgi:hypothetical protein